MPDERLEILIETEARKALESLDKIVASVSKIEESITGATSATQDFGRVSQQSTSPLKQLTSQVAKLTAAFFALRRMIRFVGTAIWSAMYYEEIVNLFQTVFRKLGLEAGEEFEFAFLERARGFVDKISDAYILDPGMLMDQQARFAQMADSMGLITESSYLMSEALTHLAIDVASLRNIEDINDAMRVLQSGLAGQIRPMRQWGVDISKTSLQHLALKYGITDSLETMSAAAKVQLRFLAIMEQLRVAMGDMARTFDAPENQLRVLRQQWALLTREVGNIFLPLVSRLMPYLNALVIVLKRVTHQIALWFGWEMPDYTETEIYLGGMEDLIEDLDTATESAKALRKAIYAFDEINIYRRSTAGGTVADMLGSGYSQLDVAIAKEHAGYMNRINEEIERMSNKAKELADRITPKIMRAVEFIRDNLGKISGLLIGLAISSTLVSTVTLLASPLGPLYLISAAIGLIVGAIVDWQRHQNEILKDSIELRNSIDEAWDRIGRSEQSFKDTYKDMMVRSELAEGYIQKLEELERAGLDAAESQEEYMRTINELKRLIPELDIVLDENTGKIKDGAAAIRDQISAWREHAFQQAVQDHMKEMMEARLDAVLAVKDAEAKLMPLEHDLNTLYDERSDLIKEFEGLGYDISRAWGEAGSWTERAFAETERWALAILDFAGAVDRDAAIALDNLLGRWQENSKAIGEKEKALQALEDELERAGTSLEEIARQAGLSEQMLLEMVEAFPSHGNQSDLLKFYEDYIIEMGRLPDEARKIGSDTTDAFAKGLDSKVDKVKEAAKRVARAVPDNVRVSLEIRSPSRVMMEQGRFTAEGYIEGLEDMQDKVDRAAMRMVAPTLHLATPSGSPTPSPGMDIGSMVTSGLGQVLNSIIGENAQSDSNINLYLDGELVYQSTLKAKRRQEIRAGGKGNA